MNVFFGHLKKLVYQNPTNLVTSTNPNTARKKYVNSFSKQGWGNNFFDRF